MTLLAPLAQTPPRVADRQLAHRHSRIRPRRPGLAIVAWQRAAGIVGAVVIGPTAVLPRIALLALLTLAALTVGLVLIVTVVRSRTPGPTRDAVDNRTGVR